MEKVQKFGVVIILLFSHVLLIQAQCNAGEAAAGDKCFFTTDVARQLILDYSWTYNNVNQPLTAALTSTIKSLLRTKFDEFSLAASKLDKNLLRHFCPNNGDCNKIDITLQDVGSGSIEATFHVEDVFRTLSESPVKESQTFLQEYFDIGFFTLQASGDLQSNITASGYQLSREFYCKTGYERVPQTIGGFSASICGSCLPGKYLNSTTKVCTPCPLSTYQGSHAQTSCQSCPNGQVTTSTGQTSSSSCETPVICDAGNYVSKKACEPCLLGEYYPSSGSQSRCFLCGLGKTTYTTKTASASGCFDVCSLGYKLLTNGSCIACPLGTYLDFPIIQRECIQCPNNLTTDGEGTKSSTLCHNIKCDPGFIRKGSNPGTCEPCAQGSYRTASMAICASCGDASRWRTDLAGATSKADCKFYCPEGFYIKEELSVKSCEPCLQDTYKGGTEYYATSCNTCPADKPKTLTTSSGSIDDCKYARCTKGQQLSLSNNLLCEDCDYGYFQFRDEPVAERCQSCPPQTTTRTKGSTTVLDCEEYCNSGFELINECQPCAIGYYKDNNQGITALFGKCQLCPIEYVTPGIGSISPGSCTVRNCSAGEFVTNSNQCQKCSRGSYQDKRYQSSCIPCPDSESTTAQEGSTSEAACSVYLFRTRIAFKIKFDLVWDTRYLDHTSQQYLTLENRILKQINKTLSAIEAYRQGLRLITMSEGSVSAHMIAKFNKQNANLQNDFKRIMDEALGTGSMSSVVVDGTQPLPVDNRLANVYEYAFKQDGDPDVCPYGFFYNYGQAICQKCPIGTYQTADIGDICLSCPTGYSTTSSGKVGDAATACLLLCAEGKEDVNGVCEPCKTGSFKSALSVFRCTTCDAGQTTRSTGSTSNSQCIAGCPAGQFSNVNKACSLCPLNKYQPAANQVECLSCPVSYKTILEGSINLSDCKDPCELDKPCLNSGTCKWSSTDSKYTCVCTSDYEGNICQTKKDICAKEQPCINGGTCVSKASGTQYLCTCQDTYTGDQCQQKVVASSPSEETDSSITYIAIGVSIGSVVIVGLIVIVSVCLCRRSPKKSKPPLPVVNNNNNTMELNTPTLPKTTNQAQPSNIMPAVAQTQPAPPPPSISTIPKPPPAVEPTSNVVLPIPPRSPATKKRESQVLNMNKPDHSENTPHMNVTTVSLSSSHEKISTRTVEPPADSPPPSRRRNSSPARGRSRSKSPAKLRRSTIPEETPFSMPPIANPLSDENLPPTDYPFDIPPEDMTYPVERPSAYWTENAFNKPPPYSKNDPHSRKKNKKSKKPKSKKVRIDTDRNEIHKLSVRSDASSNHIYMDIDEQIDYLQPSDMLSQSVPASSRTGINNSISSPLYGNP